MALAEIKRAISDMGWFKVKGSKFKIQGLIGLWALLR